MAPYTHSLEAKMIALSFLKLIRTVFQLMAIYDFLSRVSKTNNYLKLLNTSYFQFMSTSGQLKFVYTNEILDSLSNSGQSIYC